MNKIYKIGDSASKIYETKMTKQLQIVRSQVYPLTFFTSRLGGAGGVWLVSMNRLVLRLSGAEHKIQCM
jgi:hypothetical protein